MQKKHGTHPDDWQVPEIHLEQIRTSPVHPELFHGCPQGEYLVQDRESD